MVVLPAPESPVSQTVKPVLSAAGTDGSGSRRRAATRSLDRGRVHQRQRRLPARPSSATSDGGVTRSSRFLAVVRWPSVPRRLPREQRPAEHEVRRAVVEHDRAVRQVVERRGVEATLARDRLDPLVLESHVDRVGADVAVEPAPERREPVVVLPAAEGARAMTRRERRRLVEEEELGEACPGLEEWRAVPVLEDQAARDPASYLPAPPDPPLGVVQAAAIPVDEAARRCRDEIAERRDAVLERHAPVLPRS